MLERNCDFSAAALADQNADLLQGYHFGRPMEGEQFERYLSESFGGTEAGRLGRDKARHLREHVTRLAQLKGPCDSCQRIGQRQQLAAVSAPAADRQDGRR